MPHEWRRDDYLITTDPGRVDLDVVYGFLTTSYWAEGIPLETVKRSIANSIPFSLIAGVGNGASGLQVGFARVVSDLATVGYLGDVFVLPEHRGRGLATWLAECALAHPDLQGFRRWILLTRDAHRIYRRVGFTEIKKPDRWMELHAPDVYKMERAR